MGSQMASMKKRSGWQNPVLLLLGFLALMVSGCGYQADSLKLPANATRLHIGEVQNHTTMGELDVRLRGALRGLFLKNPGIRLVDREESHLSLDVSLTSVNISRTQNISQTDINSISYQITGQMEVRRVQDSNKLLFREPIAATASLVFDAPLLETHAVQAEIRNKLIDNLARQIEGRIYNRF